MKFLPKVKTLLHKLLLVVYPPVCPFCGGPCGEEGICEDCFSSLDRVEEEYCIFCGRGREHCSCEKEPFGFDEALCTLYYDERARNAVRTLKFGGGTFAGPVLGAMMAKRLADMLPGAEFHLILPAPLSKKRARKRGYNQAKLLGDEVSRAIGVPCEEGILKKIRETREQSGLGAKERRENVKGAYAVADRDAVKDKNILLVDDVLTTGSTAGELSRVLKEAGAGRVTVLSFACTKKEKES